jgi:hypothetical protein
MPKKGQYGVAPYVSLTEAISGAKEFYRQHGERGSKTFLATILGNTPKSSSFLKKIAALKAYGLLHEIDGDVRLSTLALSIVAPTKPNEEEQARTEVFFSVLLFKKMHEKLRGGLLPKPETLVNFLSKDFSILPKDAENWVKRFEESVRTVGLLSRKGTEWVVMDSLALSQPQTAIPQDTKAIKEETEPNEGEWREYTHPMGRLRIKVDAPPDVVNEFVSFLKFVILKEKTEG